MEFFSFEREILSFKMKFPLLIYIFTYEKRYLSAERAGVLAVLGNFHLLDHFPEGGTISGTVLPGDSYLLGTLGL